VLIVILYSHAPCMLSRNYFYKYVMLILLISILCYIMWSFIYLKLKCLFYYFIHISWSQCRNNDTWFTALITMVPCGILNCNMYCYNFVTRIHYMGLFLRKLGLMHVRNVSSEISLCSLDMLIRDDTLRCFGIFSFKEVPSYRKSSFGSKCRPWLACADCTG